MTYDEDDRKTLYFASSICIDVLDLLCITREELRFCMLIYAKTMPWLDTPLCYTDIEVLNRGSTVLVFRGEFSRMGLYRSRKALCKKRIVISQGYTGKPRAVVTYTLNLPGILKYALTLYGLRCPDNKAMLLKLENALRLARQVFKEKGIPLVRLKEVNMPTADEVFKKKVGVKTKRKKKKVKEETEISKPQSRLFKDAFDLESYIIELAHKHTYISMPDRIVTRDYNNENNVVNYKLRSILTTFLKEHGSESERIAQILIDLGGPLQRSFILQHGQGIHEYMTWFDWYWYHQNREWVMNEIRDRPVYTKKEVEQSNGQKKRYEEKGVPVESNKRSVEERKRVCKKVHYMA